MHLQLIRNATLKLTYGGATFLVDPYFADRHSQPSFSGRSPNPMVELPLSVDEILDGVEFVIISHLHSDHYDSTAQQALPKTLPIFCQPGDEATITSHGFENVTALDRAADVGRLRITPREGSHGLGKVLEAMGRVIGFTLEAPGEPKLYWCGDTVLYPPVLETIANFEPDVIVTHSCGAYWGPDMIVMDAAETLMVCQAWTAAKVVAVHMETLDHATVDRSTLRAAAQEAGVGADRLLIPDDGEIIQLVAG